MKKNFAIVTSLNEEYYKKCGQTMIESVSRHTNIPLYVYNEEFDFKSAKNCFLMDWNLGLEYDNFVARWSAQKKSNRILTFAKKSFSIIHALENIECDRIIWMDADTELKDKLHLQLLDLITADDVLSTHFGVKHLKNNKEYFSCETGFFILNKKHQLFSNFLENYKGIYINDDCKNLRRFYDGEVYGETVLRLENKGAKMLDLNPKQLHKTPIPRSILAPYITHYKAGLKDLKEDEI